jgi:hypothetical protein
MILGKRKDYQVKGLQWMVSLCNSRLNGILAGKFAKWAPSDRMIAYKGNPCPLRLPTWAHKGRNLL